MKPLGALVLTGVVGALAGDGGCTPMNLSDLGDDGDPRLGLLEVDYIETGDLRQLRERGILRVLVHASEAPGAAGDRAERDALIQGLARDLGLEVAWISVDAWQSLVPALTAGRGDLIASGLAVTPESRADVAFAAPVEVSRLQVIVPEGEAGPVNGAELAGSRVGVWSDSLGFDSMAWLKDRYPSITLDVLPAASAPVELLSRVASGESDAVVLPSHLLPAGSLEAMGLKVGFNLTAERGIAWAVRQGSPLLLAAVDRHLVTAMATPEAQASFGGDLADIEARGVLRVLTRPNATTAYLRRGRLAGFEFDLLRAFAHRRGLTVEVVVPPSRADFDAWLAEGRGDVVAANRVIPEDDGAGDLLAWTRPFNFASQVVISRQGEPAVDGPEDLDGRSIAVPSGGFLYDRLVALRGEWDLDLELVSVPDDMPVDERLSRVADGTYDLTVVDSNVADVVLPWRSDLVQGAALWDTAHGWTVRAESVDLLDALDTFLASTYRGTFYNLTWSRYHKERGHAPRWLWDPTPGPAAYSPWDDAARHYADAYGLDWRLVLAQMYQESRFRPSARSGRGATGLMQLLPETYEAVGVADTGPDAQIEAGVKYLARMRSWLPESIRGSERTWFALAAYNVGIGHLEDARALAVELGLDPDRWFGNVEVAVLKLGERGHATRPRYGACQGQQPVDYVRAVRARYLAYVRLARAVEPGPEWLPGVVVEDATPIPLSLMN